MVFNICGRFAYNIYISATYIYTSICHLINNLSKNVNNIFSILHRMLMNDRALKCWKNNQSK